MPTETEIALMEQTKKLIWTGLPEADAVSNVVDVLQRELKSDPKFKMNAMDIYKSDVEKIPKFPCITVDISSGDSNRLTLGNVSVTFRKNIQMSLWYYHCDVNDNARSGEINQAVSRIISVLERNGDLNGFTRLGILDMNYIISKRVKGTQIISGANIRFSVPFLKKDRAAGPAP